MSVALCIKVQFGMVLMIGPVARGKPISIELLVNAEVPGLKLLFIACVVETDLLGIKTNFKGPRFILSMFSGQKGNRPDHV